MPRPRPSLPLLSIPQDDFVGQWLDRFDSSPMDEQVEYSLNLGAESPVSLEVDATPSLPPQRKFTRRPKPAPRKQEAVDRDCGICFEYAVQPARTLCCGKIFCREHITDWLSGPSSDGRCPSCSAPCSSTIIFSSPTLSNKHVASQDVRPGATTTPPNTVNPSPRHRSQSESTNNTSTSSSGSEQSSVTTTSASSISPSAPHLSPRENRLDQPWSSTASALIDMRYPRSVSPSLSTRSHSQDEGRERVYPRSSTVEALSRLASVLGLTVLFYALLASS